VNNCSLIEIKGETRNVYRILCTMPPGKKAGAIVELTGNGE
jgi:hypothetical protein